MGNVLDCSSDPLDSITEDSHAPRSDRPFDLGAPSASRGTGAAAALADRDAGSLGGAEMEPLHENGSAGGKHSAGGSTRRQAGPIYVEKDVPLRESVIWRLQREYYERHGVKCWERMAVPCFVTSNSFVAGAYARTVAALLRDWFATGRADPSRPVTILEVGAGHGKFSFLFLKHLLEEREFLPMLRPNTDPAEDAADAAGGFGASDLPFRYVVTDVAQPILDFVAGHPSLRRFVDDGLLDVALLDAEQPPDDGSLYLQLSKRHVDLREAAGGPVIAICNYVFDTLVQDAFRVKAGRLYENRLTVTTQRRLKGGLKQLSLDKMEGMALAWSHEPFPVTTGPSGAIYGAGGGCCGQSKGGIRAHAADAAWAEAGAARAVSHQAVLEERVAGQQSDVSLDHSDSGALSGNYAAAAAAAAMATAAAAAPPVAVAMGGEEERRPASAAALAAATATGTAATLAAAAPAAAAPAAGGTARARGTINGVAEGTATGVAEASHLNGNAKEGAAAAGSTATAGAAVGSAAGAAAASAAGAVSVSGEGGATAGAEFSASGRDGDFDPELCAYVEDPEIRKAFGDDGASILVPLGALRLLRFLSGLGGGRAAVLVGDKGYGVLADLRGERDPHVAVHGSVSLMVNLDMTARYARRRGGFALNTPYREGFKCQALVFGMRESRLQEFCMAWDDAMAVLGPEGFSTLQRALREEVPEASLRHLLAVLRLSALDPDVFFKFKKQIVDQVSAHELTPSAWADLRADIDGVVAMHYQLQPSKDVNFEAARVLMAMKDFEGAMAMFAASNKACGGHHVTYHNIGVCLFHLGLHHQAVQRFQQCLQMNADFEDAAQWLQHTQRVMRQAEEEARATHRHH